MRQPPPELPTQMTTDRLILRRYQAGDGQWYAPMSVRNRPHLARYEADNPVMGIQNEADAEAVMHDFVVAWDEGRAFFLGCFRREDGAFVGQLYVGPVSWELPEFTVGYFGDQDYGGQGYITEAVRASLRLCFTHLKAHRVRLECDDTNGPSLRVAERCGFAREGHLRENRRWPDGAMSGTLLFGLLRDEWTQASLE